MAEGDDFIVELSNQPGPLLEFADAHGAAIVFRDRCFRIGTTPDESTLWSIADWLTETHQGEVFHSDAFPSIFPTPVPLGVSASGVMAISISKLHRCFLMWFRPEAVTTVQWAGDPRKTTGDGASGRLNPRQSFELWKEIVRGKSAPWRAEEIEAATDFRNAVVGIVLRKAEETAELTAELTRSNQELEAFSYSVSHDLRAPFRHIVGYSELLRERAADYLQTEDRRYLDVIIESAHYAGKLVDDLLNYSRVGRASLDLRSIDMNLLVGEVQRELIPDQGNRQVEWVLQPLPTVECDAMMMRLVFENLLSNALKFTRRQTPARIEVGAEREGGFHVFSVRDNGVGFEMEYIDKLFGVFQRLHRIEDYEGTGIGLANVRRIVARHGGRTWAEGAVGKGAVFYFTLPATAE
jgi:light-regulated signal transduction histidine kinase (bacteriophytochrome)